MGSTRIDFFKHCIHVSIGLVNREALGVDAASSLTVADATVSITMRGLHTVDMDYMPGWVHLMVCIFRIAFVLYMEEHSSKFHCANLAR